MREQIKMSECSRLRELFSTYLRCIFVGCALRFFQQTAGINTIMYYGPTIIEHTGIKINGIDDQDELAVILNIPLAFVGAIGALVAVLIIDGKGRRYIMLRTLPGCMVSLLLVALSMYFSSQPDGSSMKAFGNYLALGALVAYLAFF